MRTVFALPCNPVTLYAEIIAAIPALAAITIAGNSAPSAQVIIESDAQHTVVTTPDSTNSAAIAAVMAKHNPAPSPAVPSAKATAIAALTTAATISDVKAALVAYLHAG